MKKLFISGKKSNADTFPVFNSSIFSMFFILKHRRVALVLLLLLIRLWSGATTYYSKASGNANTTATWGTNPADGTGTAPGNFTTGGDVFILRAASALTTSSSLWTIGNNVTLQIIGSLTTGGSVTIVGTLILDGTLAVNGANNIFQIGGTGIFTNPSATQVSLAGAGAGNNFTLGAGSTFKTANVNGVSGANCSLPADAPLKNIKFSTGVNFEFNGTATQATLGLPTTLDNLTINNSNGVNLNNNVRVTETLFLTNGVFSIGSNILTLDKGVTIATGSLHAAAGTVIYNRNSNGQAVLAVDYLNLTFTNFNKILPSTGIIGVGGVFTTGTATGHTIAGSTIDFNGSAQGVPAFTYHNLQTSGSGLKTLLGAITVNGNLTIGSGTTLNASGSFAINSAGNWTNNGTFTPGSGTVTFNGNVTQLMGGANATTFNNLVLSNTSTIGLTLQRDATINTTLTLNSGILDIDGKILTLGTGANAIGGTFSNARMILASGGGEVRKAATTASQASYTFPVGDNTGTTEYSPVTLAFNGGSYNGYAGIKVIDAKHPNNANTTNFISRYWTVSTSGYTNFSADVVTVYTNADVTGTEADILMGKWDGALPWQRFPSSIDIANNTLTAAGVNAFSDFTGINSINPTVSISVDAANVCQNEPVTLTASATGDAPLSYLWNPGDVTTSALSPPTSAQGTANYSVTVTDGNGFTGNADQDIIVYAKPQGSLSGSGSICSGMSAQLTFTATSGTGPFTVIYFDGVANRTQTGVTSGAAFNVFSDPTTSTTYALVSVTDNNTCSRSSGFTDGSTTITINESPNITSQPASQTVCEGDDVLFNVNATGTGLTYQWKKDGEDIISETNSSVILNDVTPADAGSYTVVVSGTCPPTQTSDAATLTINSAPVINATNIGDIPNDANNCSASVTFGSNVTAEGNPAPVLVYKIGSAEITSPHIFPIGTTTVTVEANNTCGTTSTTFSVTVEDHENPSITCPGNITLTGNQNTATWTEPAGNDNCPGWTVSRTGPAPGSTFPVGTTTISYTVTDASGNQSSCSFTVMNNNSTISNCTNSNPILYFGYSGDQSATITATPTTGTGPYTISITMNRPLLCNQVNDAGDEVWTTGADGGTSLSNTCPGTLPPVSTKTIASGSYSVTVTLMADADIFATITDATGVTTTCTTHIHADDVRCFAGNSGKSKVAICHKTGSAKNPCVKICVDPDAVAEHIAHGDFLGKCTPDCNPPAASSLVAGIDKSPKADMLKDLWEAKVAPNPATTEFSLVIKSSAKEPIEFTVFDVYGKKVYQAKGGSNGQYRFGKELTAGIYILRLNQVTRSQTLKLIKLE